MSLSYPDAGNKICLAIGQKNKINRTREKRKKCYGEVPVIHLDT